MSNKFPVPPAAESRKSVLIVNDDNNINFEYDQSVPTFMSVFKNVGDYSAVNDIKSRRMLVDYADKGGRLLLEGGNIAGWTKEFGGETVPNRMFREKVLHATKDWVYHDVGDLILKNNHSIATTPNALPKKIIIGNNLKRGQ